MIRELFDRMCHDPKYHLGLGDIRLTVDTQAEIVDEFDRLLNTNGELLRALQSLIDGGHDADCDTHAIGDVCNCNAGLRYEAARAAIAKATGKGDGR